MTRPFWVGLRRYCDTGSALDRNAIPHSSAVLVVSVDSCGELNVSLSHKYLPYYHTKSDLKLEVLRAIQSKLILFVLPRDRS
jgi:hypothetical protein